MAVLVANSTADVPVTPATPEPKFDAAKTPPSGLGAKPSLTDPLLAKPTAKQPACSVSSASYGGKKTLLIRATVSGEQRYTALTVLDGFESSMTETFIKSRAPGGEVVGEFQDQAAAVAKAHELCATP